MHQFIENVVDIVRNGHCECVVSVMLIRYVDAHHIICIDLIREVTGNHDHYLCIFGAENQFNKVKHALTLNGISFSLRDKWMIMQNIRFRITQKYMHVVVLLFCGT